MNHHALLSIFVFHSSHKWHDFAVTIVFHICCVTEDFFSSTSPVDFCWMFTTHTIPIEVNKRYLLNSDRAVSLLSEEQPFILHKEIMPVHHQNDPSSGNTQDGANVCLFTLKYFMGDAMMKHHSWLLLALRDQCCRDWCHPQPHAWAGQTLPSEEIPLI